MKEWPAAWPSCDLLGGGFYTNTSTATHATINPTAQMYLRMAVPP